MDIWKSGSSSGAGYRKCSRDKMLRKDPQAMQLPRPFSKVMHDVAEHVFSKKVGLTQKHYMQRNLQLVGGMTMKEWVAQNTEYQCCGVESLLYKDLTQLIKAGENLWSYVPFWSRVYPSWTKPRTKSKKNIYCNMHGHNKTHNTNDCFELKRHANCAKMDEMQKYSEKVTYKDLNAFVNTK
eukprot:5647243-Ditylum_brightwellii.AAC.1